ncbi:MAG: hypothetical protein KJO43_01410, partial [Phycisphaerae bacterium]|nr:hypothetical protein [Phycisphaerae bacterium]
MQRKGISIWEQHLERLVLVGAVIFFVVFTAMQFLRAPNSVELSSEGTVKPGEVDELLRDKAVALRARLAPEAGPELDIPNRARVSDEFENALAASVSPDDGVTPSHRRVVIVGEFDVRLDVEYVEPEIPAPTQVVVEQYFDALADEVVSAHPELQERFPEVPYDLTWMTAAAVFDIKAVRDEYGKTGPDGESPIPVNWFYNNIHVFDVEVEREERAGDEWTNLVKLDPLPGQITLRDRLEGEVDSALRNELIAYLGEPGAQNAILRPDFFATRNEAWSPPDPRFGGEVAGMTDDEREALRLRKRLARTTADRDRLFEKHAELGGSMDR